MPHITEIKNKLIAINEAKFQLLCDEYLNLEGYPHIVSLGTCATAEKTTYGTPDTYFSDGDDYIFAEYTTQKEKIFEKIKDDLDKCFNIAITDVPDEHLKEIVYCHLSSNLTTKQVCALKELCGTHGVKLILIGLDELAFAINHKYPLLAKEYLDISLDTEQILRPKDFIRSYDQNRLAAPLETEFLSRKEELQQLDDILRNVPLAILEGSAGIGKTRLALEYAQKHAQKSGEILYVIRHRNLPIWDDLKRYLQKENKYFLVIDDANEVSELKLILEYLNEFSDSEQIKILITVRNYAAKTVEDIVSSIIPYQKIHIQPLSEEDIQNIVSSQYEISNPQWLKRIAAIAEGNARIVLLAAKIAVKSGSLINIRDASQLYDQYFGSVFQSINTEQNESILLVAGITSFLGTVRLDHLDPLLPILGNLGITQQGMHDTLYRLHADEIVDIYQDKAARFSDQCFANYILKRMLIDDKKVRFSQLAELFFSNYPDRVVLTSNMLCEVFQNQEIANHIYSEIRSVWNKFKAEKPSLFWEFAKRYYPVNPLDMLLILRKKVDACSSIQLAPEDLDTEKNKNYNHVSDEMLQILGGYADTDNMQAALELIFSYYLKRPDLYMQVYHTITHYFEICENSFYEKFNSQITLAQTIEKFSDNWDNKYITILFFTLAEHFLSLLFQPIESGRKAHTIVLNTIFLPAKSYVLEFRNLLWNFLCCISEKSLYHNQIRNLLTSYGNSFDPICFDVIQNDCGCIEKLVCGSFSENSLADCIVADHIQQVLERANIHSPVIADFANSAKMGLYKLLTGIVSYSNFEHYEEFQSLQREQLASYLFSFKKLEDGFINLLELLDECDGSFISFPGIINALEILTTDKQAYLLAVQALIDRGIVHKFNALPITAQLFKFTNAEHVFCIVNNAKKQDLEYLTYCFFHELPSEKITLEWLTQLYYFLSCGPVYNTEEMCCRDISFLDKYSFLDKDIMFKAADLLLQKSPFVLHIYFWQYFQQSNPEQIVLFWKNHLDTLEKLYLTIDNCDSIFDADGTLLLELCRIDTTFVKVYIDHMVIETVPEEQSKRARIRKFLLLDQFCNVIDGILEWLSNSHIGYYILRRLIEVFVLIPQNESELTEPSDFWIKNSIKQYNTDHKKMALLSDVLCELPNERNLVYMQLFLQYNRNYNDFCAIRFSPTEYSILGSRIPIYQKEMDFFEGILPMLTGLDFIEHKRLILSSIDSLNEEIADEELDNILSH